jgi:hypothetical protein
MAWSAVAAPATRRPLSVFPKFCNTPEGDFPRR